MYPGKETAMDEAKQDHENGPGLYTLGLACCIGISVCGTYTHHHQRAGEEARPNAFMAHLADGPAMERTWQSLKRQVDGAKRDGLAQLRIQVCVVDPATLGEDEAPGMRWSQGMMDEQGRLNDDYIRKAAALRDDRGSRFRVAVHRHHINEVVDMRITRDRRMLVVKA
ncbi:hypothetical protein KVR01_006299 [Diaporthe batatas]|uniref:uncharacterized protein n=1 Tax=Diaporthe batatas TaxID=748121 RepID=UPI001D05BBD0|nr:uncharacterized protein KVR01_006299 [Diaporthe batatas]KAG8164381.1 hypothetical protein KVR01_006299 [Diaporthe batatas]